MRPEKKAIVQQLREEVDGARILVLTEMKGLSVEKSEDLRRRLSDVDGHVRVVKNRLFREAATEGMEGLQSYLKGPTAVIFGNGDPVQAAQVVQKFVQENRDKVAVKGGFLEHAVLAADDVKMLADLPPKPVLQSILLGTLAAPMTRLAGVMQQKVASILYVLKAIEDKKAS